MSATHHIPLRVRAYPAGPVVTYGDGLPLDGPLAWAAYDALDDDARDALPPISGPVAVDFALPLAKWGEYPDGLWGWCCSWACIDHKGETRAEIRKRTIADEAIQWAKDKSLPVSAGRYKPCDLAYPAIIAPTITWYATGDAVAVQRLLDRVPAIGKSVNKGYGKILRWEVEPHHADLSMHYDGEIMRALPPDVARPLVKDPDAYTPRAHGVRAPYHHASRRALVWTPAEEVLRLVA